MKTSEASQKAPQRSVTLTAKDLPVYCPSKQSALWAEHPRVYLHLDDENKVTCPYCNTQYLLKS